MGTRTDDDSPEYVEPEDAVRSRILNAERRVDLSLRRQDGAVPESEPLIRVFAQLEMTIAYASLNVSESIERLRDSIEKNQADAIAHEKKRLERVLAKLEAVADTWSQE